MPVIINELEIVVESPPAPPADAPLPPAPTPAAPGPLELNELIERRTRLSRRILAH